MLRLAIIYSQKIIGQYQLFVSVCQANISFVLNSDRFLEANASSKKSVMSSYLKLR